jgi:hypothetical protein
MADLRARDLDELNECHVLPRFMPHGVATLFPGATTGRMIRRLSSRSRQHAPSRGGHPARGPDLAKDRFPPSMAKAHLPTMMWGRLEVAGQ